MSEAKSESKPSGVSEAKSEPKLSGVSEAKSEPKPNSTRAWTDEARDLDGWVGGERNGGCMVLSHGCYRMVAWCLRDDSMVVT